VYPPSSPTQDLDAIPVHVHVSEDLDAFVEHELSDGDCGCKLSGDVSVEEYAMVGHLVVCCSRQNV
jgi:hypothetical protein